jgi:hypothetical protein
MTGHSRNVCGFALVALLLWSPLLLAEEPSMPCQTQYRTVRVEGLNIFYREAGPKDAPVILMLHGFPSSSRMFEHCSRGSAIDFI